MSKKTVTPEPETQKQDEGEKISGIAGQAEPTAEDKADDGEPRRVLGMQEG